MVKNLRLYYILTFALAGVVVAWKSLAVSLCGIGTNFVLVLVLAALMLMLLCTDGEVKTRVRDLFVVSAGFVALELIPFLVFEIFNNTNAGTAKGFNVYQSIISFFGLVFFAYVVFRFICEINGKKIKFVEILLGNVKREKKVKKAKELTNGSLMEKPSAHKELETATSVTQPEAAVPPAERASEQNFGLSTNLATTSLVVKNDEESEK